jgi:hypothetical protein
MLRRWCRASIWNAISLNAIMLQVAHRFGPSLGGI